uniref:Uncharacterized protein n=1 Tax=Caenorhabditis japonica TaxID=281687 RepID=A0A8R1IK92_CAEJA
MESKFKCESAWRAQLLSNPVISFPFETFLSLSIYLSVYPSEFSFLRTYASVLFPRQSSRSDGRAKPIKSAFQPIKFLEKL